jgi:uncharacterized protein (TIGR03083 family)
MADADLTLARTMIAALRRAQGRLATLVASLPPEQLTAPSYDTEWTIADVLSHLGSGGEIFGAILEAGLTGREVPGMEAFPVAWERWNAKTPAEQAADAVTANEAFVARMEAATDAELAAFDVALFGMQIDAAMIARMRLSEEGVHTWDVAVALDPDARIDRATVALLLDNLPALAGRTSRPDAPPARIHVHTTDPAAEYLLVTGTGAGLTPWAGDEVGGTLTLPAEAFLRLVYGRLDADHTPTAEITTEGTVDLPALRAAFPGF